MKKLFIALMLLVVSLPVLPIQKDYEKRPVVISSYEWRSFAHRTSHSRNHPTTIINFKTGERRAFKGWISFSNYRPENRGFLILENSREVFCLESNGRCWMVWNREP